MKATSVNVNLKAPAVNIISGIDTEDISYSALDIYASADFLYPTDVSK